MNKFILITFGLVGFSLFAPPKIAEPLPPFFEPSKEIQESEEYKKAHEGAECGDIDIFLYGDTPYIVNKEGKIRHCQGFEKKSGEKLKKIREELKEIQERRRMLESQPLWDEIN